jgi:hypothetical protein
MGNLLSNYIYAPASQPTTDASGCTVVTDPSGNVTSQDPSGNVTAVEQVASPPAQAPSCNVIFEEARCRIESEGAPATPSQVCDTEVAEQPAVAPQPMPIPTNAVVQAPAEPQSVASSQSDSILITPYASPAEGSHISVMNNQKNTSEKLRKRNKKHK